jgi:uncharacterized protein YdaU (DUF1376 family)
MNYYEHHIGDYAEATAHLTFVEDAAYSRMIRKYYAQEKPLPVDVKAVQRLIAARTKEEREAVEIVLNEFFTLEADGWHNGRCDTEIARYQDKQAKAKRSAEARWNKPQSQSDGNANASPNAMRTHTEGNAHQTPDTRHQTPDVNHTAPTQPELGAVDPTPVGLLSKAMRDVGIMGQPADPRLIALAEQGVSVETMRAACEDAKRSKPSERIAPAYVFAILERWAKEAATLNAAGAAQPRASPRQAANANMQRLNDRINGKARHDQRDEPELIDINERPA